MKWVGRSNAAKDKRPKAGVRGDQYSRRQGNGGRPGTAGNKQPRRYTRLSKENQQRLIQLMSQHLTHRPPEKARANEGGAPPPAKRPKKTVSPLLLRKDVAIVGINAVARALEKGRLSAVLTCCDVKPRGLMKHIASMTRQFEVPHCELQGVQRVLAHMFNIKRAVAVGILAQGNDIDVAEIVQTVALNSMHHSNPPP
jgi:ribosomal protein L7Ae-like RNA K-turn-binding protein